jgi:hypothetical protein
LPEIGYPFHDRIIVVTHSARICLGRKKINFSAVIAGQPVAIEKIHDDTLQKEPLAAKMTFPREIRPANICFPILITRYIMRVPSLQIGRRNVQPSFSPPGRIVSEELRTPPCHDLGFHPITPNTTKSPCGISLCCL